MLWATRSGIAYFFSEFRVFIPGEYRRRQTDGRFARKDRAETFPTILDDKFVLYTAGSYTSLPLGGSR